MGVHRLLFWAPVCGLFQFLPQSLEAQITIRDTVRIDPGLPQVATALAASTIKLVFTLSGNLDTSPNAPKALVMRNRFCGDHNAATIEGSVTTVEIPARGLGVEANTSFRVRQSPNVQRTYAFYLDGELVDSLHVVDQCPVACQFSGHILSVPLYTSFSLGVNNPFHPFELDHGETTQNFTMNYSSSLCGTPVWHPKCATTVRIIDGAQLGTLIGPGGSDLGDMFVGNADEIRQLRFSANGEQPAGEIGEAVVEVSGRGITSVVTFEITRTVPPVHHLEVVLEPDTVYHGMSAQVLAVAVDEEGAEVDIPPDTPLGLYVGAGSEQYGDLAASIHGTLVKGDQLSGVRYDQATSGGVVYLADGENPIGRDPVPVPIGMQLEGQPDASGVGEVVVGCRIDPPRYAQGDSRWGDDHYDHAYKIENSDTTKIGIRTLGCALSSMAMAMSAFGVTVDPGELNEYKKDTSTNIGFRFVNDFVQWEAIEGYTKKRVLVDRVRNVDSLFSPSALDGYLATCDLIVAKVFNSESVKNKPKTIQNKARREGNHWILIKGKKGDKYDILDPGGRDIDTLDEYGRIYRFVRVFINRGLL